VSTFLQHSCHEVLCCYRSKGNGAKQL
jgi:hypothetical protein